MVGEDIRELGVEGVLDAVQTWHATRVEADIAIFVAAAHFADLHSPAQPIAKPARGGRVLPGMEQTRRLGGEGTPLVWEFAVAEFAARIGKSSYAGRQLVADALDTRHRLPRLWVRVCAGEVPAHYARHVAQATRELDQHAAGLVDAEVVGYADGRLTWSRFQNLVAAKIVEADPAAAAERERKAAEEEFVKVGRSNEHGQKTMYVKSAGAAIIRVFATIDFFAQVLAALGDTDTLQKRHAKALLVMANPVQALQLLQTFAGHRAGAAGTDNIGDAGEGEPEPRTFDDLDDSDQADGDDTTGLTDVIEPRRFRPHQIRPDGRFRLGFDPRKLLPPVTLYLHLYARTDTGEVGPVARWEGEGPITTEYLREVLGPACDFVVKPVIDLAGMAPVDAYEIPDRHREAVHLRTPADVFPYASNTTRRQQLDHTSPYLRPDHGGPPGQTDVGNLGPMTGFHHRVKTHGAWQVKQPFPGIYLWRDPGGRTYLVDHTGTRPLGNTDPGSGLPDITIDIIPATPGVDCCYEGAHAC
jgi:hypothetical protein